MQQSNDKSDLGSFDSLYHGVLIRLFKSIQDSRADNSSYDLLDALKCGFAIYSLKFVSLFSFRKLSKAEDSNLGSVYGIQNISTDNFEGRDKRGQVLKTDDYQLVTALSPIS